MNEYLQISHKMLASKQASKHISYTNLYRTDVCVRTMTVPAGWERKLSPGRDCFISVR